MKIGAYVVSKQAKQTYSNDNFDVRAWPGFEMILDCLRRSGQQVTYAGKDTAHTYDIMLVSLTSDCDWWAYLAERSQWVKSKTRVIAGGPGVLNVRPFLPYVDVFVLGRGENIINNLINAEVKGERLDNKSVIYSDTFDINHKYQLAQAKEPYPYEYILTNGKPFKETSIGCPNKCYYCNYSWSRKYIGDGSFTAGAAGMLTDGNREHTIIDMLKMPTEQWQATGPFRITALDGMSERLRFQANKRITRNMLREFLTRLATIEKPHQLKIYNIVGYPNETKDDWNEFIEDLSSVDSKLTKGKQWQLLCHYTPFRAMPNTPSAIWPMAYQENRGKISQTLKSPFMPGNVFYQGNKFWCVEGMGTDSLSSVILSALVWRGIESDSDNVMKLARTAKFWGASSIIKRNTLEAIFDTKRLFKAYTWDNLPTRYLETYISYHKAELINV
jgi:hypothetical protein